MFRFVKPRVLAALGFGAIVAVTASGFAAANTVPTSKGGDGAGSISGYAVSNIKYVLNASDPRNIDSVTFDVDVAPPAALPRRSSSCPRAAAGTRARTRRRRSPAPLPAPRRRSRARTSSASWSRSRRTPVTHGTIRAQERGGIVPSFLSLVPRRWFSQ